MTNINNSSPATSTPATAPMPPSTQGTVHSAAELAQAIGVGLSDLFSGKGLKKLLEDTPANAAENAKIIAENTTIQKKQSEVLSSLMDQQVAELKAAFLVIANPKLKGTDEELAAKALIEVTLGKVKASKAAEAAGSTDPAEGYNPFLGGLVSIALAEAMMEYMKTQQVGEKIASEMWLETKGVVEDVTDMIAQNIKDKARAEAIEHIVMAACSAGAMVAQVGGGVGSMRASNMSKATGWNLGGQGIATLFTGVLQNMALAPIAILKGNLDAEKVVMEMQKDFLQTMMQKQKEMGDDYSKNFADFNEAMKKWLSSVQELCSSITPHK